MDFSKTLKRASILTGFAVAIGLALASYLWFMPHRNVQALAPDIEITSKDLVERYLTDADAANAFFLKEDGDSKILALSGTIMEVSKNLDGNTVLRIADPPAKAGARCTLTAEASALSSDFAIGQNVTLKGVIRAGPEYDELIGIYIDAVMDDCAPYQS